MRALGGRGREEIRFLEGQVAQDSGPLGVGAGGGDRPRMEVLRQNGLGSLGERLGHRLGLEVVPGGLLEGGPALEEEAAMQARRQPAGDQRRLDGKGPSAAHRVEEGRRAVVAGRQEDTGRQGLANRGLGRGFPVAALVQQLAGGVQRQEDPVLLQPYKQELGGGVTLGKRRQALLVETRLDGFPQGPLDLGIRGHARGAKADLDAKGQGRQQGLPADVSGMAEELLGDSRPELGDPQENAVRGAKPEVRLVREVELARELHSSGERRDVRGREFGQLTCENRLQAGRAGGEEAVNGRMDMLFDTAREGRSHRQNGKPPGPSRLGRRRASG
ncbi:hypothetical protein D3C87_1182130 [compost metagenome]